MSMQKDFNLRPLWDAMLSIFDEFSKICERHNLRYYAYAGTALGAVRHNGFIPWDDDMDVAMPRPDYEEFIRISKKELPMHLKFVNWKNTHEFHMIFGKIQLADAEQVTGLEKQMGRTLSNGVFIDIFPLDGYPEGCKFYRNRVKVFLMSLMERFRFNNFGVYTWKGKFAWIAGAVLSLLTPHIRDWTSFLSIYEKMLLDAPFETSKMVGDAGYGRSVFFHPCYEKKVWDVPVPHKFEDRVIMLPSNVDSHLKAHFGDYLKLPPEEARKPAHQFPFHFPWWLGPTDFS